MDDKSYATLDSNALEQELGRVKYNQEFGYAVRTTIYALITVVAFALLFATLFFPVLQIYGTSMSPAVTENSFVLAVKTGNPKQGDILAFYYNNKIIIRRVIGGPGDKIEIDDAGTVKVNGQVLDESSYVMEKSIGNCNLEFPYTVPEGQYFVMSDHRTNVIDSRNSVMGCASEEEFIGVVKFTIWPLKNIGFVK